jgi:hypothetical protein
MSNEMFFLQRLIIGKPLTHLQLRKFEATAGDATIKGTDQQSEARKTLTCKLFHLPRMSC